MQLRFLLWTLLIALSAGIAHATTDECLNAYRFEQDDKALELCKPLAEQGNIDAETVMGKFFIFV